MKAQRGSRGFCSTFFNLGARWGLGGQRHAPAALPDLVPIVQEAGWAPWPVWTGAENLAPTGIRSPGVAIPTTLSRPTDRLRRNQIFIQNVDRQL